jgi:hypothetical protein
MENSLNHKDKKKEGKKRYKKPTIIKYGAVSELTKGATGSNADSGQRTETKRGRGTGE